VTEAERIARATRANAAMDEFVGPMLDEMEAEYSARIVEVAATDLFFWTRSSKLTRLSDALRMVRSIRGGMSAIITDGEIAANDRARAEKIKQMSKPSQRLLRIGSGY
jgi:threonine synthase